MRVRIVAALVAVVAVLAWAPGGASAQTARQTFVLYQGPDEENFTVYASGPISAVGTDFLLREGVEPSTGRTQRMTETVFPGGSTFNTLTVQENNLAFDPRTCVARITGRSHLDITGGTGAYQGVTGGGEVTFQAISIAERTPGGCSRTNTRTYSVAYITGTATLP
ncbi:MAG TPA: hypothetical protein VM388_16165 [Acidimicrobiales bacterium]|nr:hypothetical protein [Acidimicrobiales bacterium]HWI02960.1 hypothetical protein [Acidimicrobiales bacterium]